MMHICMHEKLSSVLFDLFPLMNTSFLLLTDGEEYSEGVPLYPLYKHLASAFHRCLTSGTFCGTSNTMTQIQENELLKQKANEWSKLMMDKGSELMNVR